MNTYYSSADLVPGVSLRELEKINREFCCGRAGSEVTTDSQCKSDSFHFDVHGKQPLVAPVAQHSDGLNRKFLRLALLGSLVASLVSMVINLPH